MMKKRFTGVLGSLLVVISLTMAPSIAANPTKAEMTKAIATVTTTLDKAIKDLAKKNSEQTPSESTYQTIFGSIAMPNGAMLNPKTHSITDMYNYGIVVYLCPEGNGAKPCVVATNSNNKSSTANPTPNNSSTNTTSSVNNVPNPNNNSSTNNNSSVNTSTDPNQQNPEATTPEATQEPVKIVIPKVYKSLTVKQKLDTLVVSWSYLNKIPSKTKIVYFPYNKPKASKSVTLSGKTKSLTLSKLIAGSTYKVVISSGNSVSKSAIITLIAKPAAPTNFKSTPIGDTLLLTWLPDYEYINSKTKGTPQSIMLKLTYNNPSTKSKTITLNPNISNYTLKASDLLNLKTITLNYSNNAGLSTDIVVRQSQTYLDHIKTTQLSSTALNLSWPINPDAQESSLLISGSNLLRNGEIIKLDKGVNTIELKNLSPKGTYSFTIKETYSDSSIDTLKLESYVMLSDPLTPYTLAVIPGNTIATISWQSADTNNKVSYIVGYKLTSATDWTTLNTTSLSYNLSGLSNNQSYMVKVASTNPLSTSTYSAPVTFTPINIPSTPTNLLLSPKDSSVVVTWSPPVTNPTVNITSYLVEYKLTSALTYTSTTVPSTNLSLTIPNLTNGISYDVRISSMSTYGNSLPTSILSTTPYASMFYVTTQAAINTSQGAQISWTPSLALLNSSQLMGYLVEYKLQASTQWSSISQGTNQAPSYVITNLVPGLTYNYRVTPIMGGGFTDSLAPISVMSFTAASYSSNINNLDGYATANGVQLYWSTSPGSSVTYSLYYQVTGSSSWLLISGSILTTSYTVTSLNPGTSYNFKVISSTGVTFPPLSLTPTASLTLPSTPLNLLASTSVYTGNNVTLVWSAPASNGSTALTSYLVEYKLSSSSSWTVFSNNSLSTTATISGLVAGSLYNFKVSAVNSSGTGVSALASETPAAAPSAPGNVNSLAASRGAGSVLLTWLPPTNSGTAAIVNYYIYQKLTSASVWSLLSNSQVSPNFTATGLTPGSSYDFKVQANNGLSLGAGSEVTASPFNLSTAPLNLSAVKSTSSPTALTLTWDNPSNNGGSLVTSYQVQKKASPSVTWLLVSNNNLSNSIEITGLDQNTSYDFSVTPINSAGYGTPSYITTTTYSAPSAPLNLSAISSYYSLALSWSTPSSNGGSSVTGYQVFYKLSSDSAYSELNCPTLCPTATTLNLNTSLLPGQSYDIKIIAVNAVGNSLPSYATFNTLAAVAPSIIQNGLITTGLNTVNLSWSAPVSDNGSPILSYSISYAETSLGVFTLIYTGLDLSAMATGTTTGVSYDFQIIATNAIGNSTPVTLTIISD